MHSNYKYYFARGLTMQTTLIQLITHYTHYQLGIAGDQFTKDKKKQLKKIRKIERNLGSGKNNSYNIQEVAVALEELPQQHITLMKALNWLSEYLATPIKRDGFYSESWNPNNQFEIGTILTKYFISIDKYVELLTIEYKLSLIGANHE